MNARHFLLMALLSGKCAYAQQPLSSLLDGLAINRTIRPVTEASQVAADEAADVRNVIETETRAFHEANVQLLRTQWSDKTYVERLQDNLQTMLGTPFLKGEQYRTFIESYAKNMKPTGHTVKISDYDAHISGPMAWATFTDEELDNTGNVIAKKRHIRVLERDNTGWKIVYLAFVTMK